MESSPSRFFGVCLATVLVLSGHAFGSVDDRGHWVMPSADNEPELHDIGKLLLGFCIASFVMLHLAAISYKTGAGNSNCSDDGADHDEIDTLDVIVLMFFQCLHIIVSSLCTAVATCWQSITHIFTTTFTAGPTSRSSVSVPHADSPLASSPLAATPGLPDPMVARSSSSFNTCSTSGAMGALINLNSCLTRENKFVYHRLQEMISSKRQLQQQLQDTLAALLTSRSNAESAGALAAQAVAEKQHHKAALREMRACVEEMYMEGELAFACILNKKEKVAKGLQQEKASRVQEMQTLMDQVHSLTDQLTFSQGEVTAEQQKSKKLAKRNTQLKQERDTAKRTAMAVGVTLRRMIDNQTAAEREEAWRKTEAFLAAWASKKAPVGPGTRSTTALPCSTSSPSPPAVSTASPSPSPHSSHSRTVATAPAKKQEGVSSGTFVGCPPQAVYLTAREPFSDSSNQQLVVQAAATQTVSAGRSISSSVVPRETEACSTSITLGAKENIQPAPCAFSFSSRRRPCLETRMFSSLPQPHSPAEAVSSPVNRQSLSPTTATEGYSHVTMRYTDDAKTCPAQLSRSAATAPNKTNTGNSIQALATAAKAVSSAASNSLLSPAATEADNTTKSSCASSAVQADHDTTTNMAAINNDCTNCHVPTAKKMHMMGSIAASRLDEASLSLTTLADRYRNRGHRHLSERMKVH